MFTVLSILGTRPEATKLAPVIRALEQHPKLSSKVCVTGQHRQQLDPFLKLFNIKPDWDLNVMLPNQSLFQLTSKLLLELESVLDECQPNLILVQGDTTTVLAGSLAAYYRKIPLGHVEAGLRSQHKFSPFPEEINRRLADHLSDLWFVPTAKAREALLREGIQDEKIFVTGNTGIDTLHWMLEKLPAQPNPSWSLPNWNPNHRLVLVTGHRRESFGDGFAQICKGLKMIVEQHNDVELIYPVHLNPNVREPVTKLLGHQDRIHLIEPLAYEPFVYLMNQAHLVLTDSGGIQEEAPSLGKPVLVMRNVTERMEGIEAGVATLVSTDADRILAETSRLLTDDAAYQQMAKGVNPYGDGHAAQRIVAAIEQFADLAASH